MRDIDAGGVDEARHLARVLLDLPEMVLSTDAECILAFVKEDLRKTPHPSERRAKIVNDGIAERFKFAIRHLELKRALFDLTFEALVHADYRLLAVANGLVGTLAPLDLATQATHYDQDQSQGSARSDDLDSLGQPRAMRRTSLALDEQAPLLGRKVGYSVRDFVERRRPISEFLSPPDRARTHGLV